MWKSAYRSLKLGEADQVPRSKVVQKTPFSPIAKHKKKTSLKNGRQDRE